MTDLLQMKPIGYVSTTAHEVPRFYANSDVTGKLVFDEVYTEGLADIRPGERIYVIFQLHLSRPFDMNKMQSHPPHGTGPKGVFSTRSPVRPNPLGLSIVEVTACRGHILEVKGLDMLDGTPVLDIKPVEKN